MSVWSLLLVQSSKEPPNWIVNIAKKMIFNVQNDRTNKEPIFSIYVIVLYSRALSMEEWMSLSLAGQDAIFCPGVTGSTRALFPGVTGAPPPPTIHKYKTDRTQSETSRWSHVPHSHLKSTFKKKDPKKKMECSDQSSTDQCWAVLRGDLKTSGSHFGWEPEWELDWWFSAQWDLPPTF
jgi:hypothetical protein